MNDLLLLIEINDLLSDELLLRWEIMRYTRYFQRDYLVRYYAQNRNLKFKNYSTNQLITAYKLSTADELRERDRLINLSKQV